MTDQEILEDVTAYAKKLALKYGFQNSEQVNKHMIRMVLSQLSWEIEDLRERLEKVRKEMRKN